MSVMGSNIFKFSTVKVVLLALFVIINVALYTQSRSAIMEAIFPQFLGNRSAGPSPSPNNSRSRLGSLRDTSAPFIYKNSYREFRHRVLKSDYKPFLQEKIVNSYNFRYIIKPNVSCFDREVELVVCVVVSQDNRRGRSVIRNTWGSYARDKKNKALMVFFVGTKGKTMNTTRGRIMQSRIEEEASTYGDILQQDYFDSYENLSLKSVSILKWVSSYCFNAKFVLKVDDDMYINIPFLVTILQEHSLKSTTPSAFVMGSMQIDAQPMRNPSSKWYTSYSMFQEHVYPNYVSGTAYVMTTDAAVLLYEASLRVPRFWLEDVYITGLCSNKANVKIFDSRYFSYGKPLTSGCSFKRHISGHRYSQAEIIQIHKELNDPGLLCMNY